METVTELSPIPDSLLWSLLEKPLDLRLEPRFQFFAHTPRAMRRLPGCRCISS
jgi:hypothetical protein